MSSELRSLCGQDVRAPSYPDLRWRKAIMNIVQKIDTGGTSRTSTPMLKFHMNELFAPSDARHITHCANVGSAISKTATSATITNHKECCIFIELPARLRLPAVLLPQ